MCRIMIVDVWRMPPLTLVCAMLCVSACVAAFCPPRCECSETQRTVSCASAGLSRIPAAIPRDATRLSITGNSIQRLEQSAFNALQNVTHLNLSSNGIMEVGSQAFSCLQTLRSLILNDNRLVLIHPEAFSVPGSPLQELSLRSSLHNYTSLTDLITALRWGRLSSLQRLDLSANHLVLLPPAMFSPLPNLQHLHLSENSLSDVHSSAFSGVERLLELDLTRNAMRSFSGEGLRELERLPRVRLLLSQNPYACTCDTEEFVNWLNSSRVRVGDVEKLFCSFPAALRHVSLLALSAQALGCRVQPVGEEVIHLTLQTSYVFLGLVLGFVGMVFLFVVYLNRKGIKKWIADFYEACRDVLEGYQYRYELDSDPRLQHISQDRAQADTRVGRVPSAVHAAQIPSDVAL